MKARHIFLPLLLFFCVRLLLVGFFGPRQAPNYDDTIVYYGVSRMLSESWQAWVQPAMEFGFRAPFYFVYLAGMYRLLPDFGYRAAQIATLLLGVVTCLFVYRLMRTSQGEPAARVAFWLCGLLPPFVIGDTFVMTEPLFAALQMAAILVFVSAPCPPSGRYAIVLGLLIGACMLTREAATLYPVIFGGAIFLVGGPTAKRLKTLALFFCALTLSLLPWMGRNVIVYGKPLPLSNSSGQNLHIGNNPNATGRWHAPPLIPPHARIRWGTPEASKWHTEQALRYIKDNPGRFLLNGVKKIAWFLFPSFRRDELMHIYDGSSRLLSHMSVLSGGTSALLLLFGFAGFILKEPDRFWWLSAGIFLYYFALTFVSIGSSRFRDPVDHILICYAATLLTTWRGVWADLRSSSTLARRKAFVVGGMVVFVLASWALVALMKARLQHF